MKPRLDCRRSDTVMNRGRRHNVHNRQFGYLGEGLLDGTECLRAISEHFFCFPCQEIRPIQPRIDIRIQFQFGLDRLTSDAKAQLTHVARALKSEGLQRALIAIEGHTDNVGSTASNQMLSERRANAVKTVLVALEVDNARLQTKGMGESQPVASNDTDAGRALNRRVSFVNIGNQ